MRKERKVVVTGASSGIGWAVAERLAAKGQRVVGLARDFGKTPDAAEKLSTVNVDFADMAALPRRLSELVKGNPQVDALICCAGYGQFGSLEEFSYEQIQNLVNVNLTSQLLLVRGFLPVLKQQASADIILIGSEAALSGGRRGAVYSAAKFALRGFAQALRDECARSATRVSIINPGMVKTPFFDQLHFQPGASPENYLIPEDIADAVEFVLMARPETVFDEISLSPLKKVIDFKKC